MARRVLVCDDDVGVRDLLAAVLGQVAGLELVGTASDGIEVVAAVEAHAPDVVIMDLEMPRRDGAGATAELRRRGFSGAILVFTGSSDPAAPGRAFAAGADAVVRKDTVAQLVAALTGS